MSNTEGEIIYINNKLYSLLQIQSEDVIHKKMQNSRIPSSIVDIYSMAIKRRSKVENAELVIEINEETKNESGEIEVQKVDLTMYANVIPIRGKESALDYYIMVMSVQSPTANIT